MELEDRLWGNTAPGDDGCLLWIRYTTPDGYGMIWNNHTMRIVTRVAWELTYGPIPDGLHVLHRCDNPPCCEPTHLFLGTNADNCADKAAKGRCHNQKKTHCIRGHAFDEANTRIKEGRRQCRTCGRAEVARRRARNLVNASHILP